MDRRLDIYSDFLLTSVGLATATGLSTLLDGDLSHDAITRLLRENEYGPRELWQAAKPLVRRYESPSGVLIFDDTIAEKPYTDENELICWHWDHSKERSVKGIGLLSAFYHSGPLCVPVSYELILKTEHYVDAKTGKQKRRSAQTKNEQLRQMFLRCVQNRIPFGYVLADSWFASNENMHLIADKQKFFIFEIKCNRLAATSLEDKLAGRWTQIRDLDLSDHSRQTVWLKGLKMPVQLIRQVFTNKDGSTGERYLITNDMEASFDQITTTYQRRWKVEEYHKSLKQHAAMTKSPTKTLRSQSNHLFASLIAYLKLEKLKLAKAINHFAIRAKLLIAANRAAFKELERLSHSGEYSTCRA